MQNSTDSKNAAKYEFQLEHLVDALARGECTDDQFLTETLGDGDSEQSAAWEVLSVIEQRYRSGRLPQSVFESIKSQIARRMHWDDSEDAATFDDWRDAATIELFPPAVAAIAAQLATTATPAVIPAPALRVAEEAADPAAAHVGRVLRHRYVVEKLLGRGGMGDVYKASAGLGALRAESPTPVAVKMLRDRIERRPDLMQRLQREFDCTRRLSHPNIVKVYEFERNDQFAFYTMELLEGEHLGALLGRAQIHPLPQAYAWSIIGAVGAALAHAHARNVVHGDISPKNVVITRDGEVRVLDFGSSSLSQGLGAAAATAAADSIAATPAYASCEVLEGQKADPRDDLYALACLAYELLAGEHPFRGKRSTEARDLGLRPRRPPGVNFLRWRTLQRGLAWTRAERSMPIRDWLGGLGLEPQPERLPMLSAKSAPPPVYRMPLARGMALGIAVLAGAALAWHSYVTSPVVTSPVVTSPVVTSPAVTSPAATSPAANSPQAVSPDLAVPTGPPVTAGTAPPPAPAVSDPSIAKPDADRTPEAGPWLAALPEPVPLAAGLPEPASSNAVAPQAAQPQVASLNAVAPQAAQPQPASLNAVAPQAAQPQVAPLNAVAPQAAQPQVASLEAAQVAAPQVAPRALAELPPAPQQATQPQAASREAQPQVAPPPAAAEVETPLVAMQEAAPQKSAPRGATVASRATARPKSARAHMTARAHSMISKARATTAAARSKALKAHSTIQFTDHRYPVSPRARFVETHVRRSRASGDTNRFVWWTDDATAKAGVDFVAQAPTPYFFSSGRQLASLFVRLVPNPARTQEANFHVCLGKPGSGSALTDVTCSAILLPANASDPST